MVYFDKLVELGLQQIVKFYKDLIWGSLGLGTLTLLNGVTKVGAHFLSNLNSGKEIFKIENNTYYGTPISMFISIH